MAKKLSSDEINQRLTTLTGWTVVKDKLHKEFVFPDFIHAFGFMATSAIGIEKMNHHPEWCNVYSRVTVDLVTHDASGITTSDFELAALLDANASKLQ